MAKIKNRDITRITILIPGDHRKGMIVRYATARDEFHDVEFERTVKTSYSSAGGKLISKLIEILVKRHNGDR
jgi:hypothetical protein